MIENEAYDLMVNLLAENVFLAKRKNNPFKESNKPGSPPMQQQLGHDAPFLNVKIDRTWLNDIELKKAQDSPTLTDFQLRSPRKLTKEFQEDAEPHTRNEDLVKLLI